MLEKRPIVTIAIGYIIGIIIGLYCKISIVFLYVFIGAIYSITREINHEKKFKLISFRRYFRYIKIIFTKKVIFMIILTSTISNLIVLYQNKKYTKLYEEFRNQEIDITVEVISNKKEKEYNDIYKVKYKNIYFYMSLKKSEKDLKYGDIIKIKGTYLEPNSQRNTNCFDYKEYLKTLKIIGTIKVSKFEMMRTKCSINEKINKIFLNIKSLIEKNFSEENARILLGIVLGYTDELDENIQEQFSKCNISHVLAVSGMHVSYLVLLIDIFFERWIGKREGKIISLIILTLYMFLTGLSPSVVRATIMMVLVIMANLLYRKSDVWQNISLSMLILLFYNPFLIENISFILSFLGSIGILIMKKYIGKSYIKLSITVTITIIPIISLYYNQIVGSSLIISTFIGLLIGPIMLLSLCFISLYDLISLLNLKIIFIKLIEILLNILKYITNFGSKLPFTKIYVVTPNMSKIIIYYAIVFIAVNIFKIYHTKDKSMFNKRMKNLLSLARYRFNQNKKKFISIILIFIIIFNVIKVIPKDLRIYFVDVGQGDSCLILTPKSQSILIDGGGSDNFNVGKNILIPYLLGRGVRSIDFIIISHFDSDHILGVLYVMKELNVRNVIIGRQFESCENYENFINLVKEKNINVHVVEAGKRVNIEKDIYFDILWPDSKNVISYNCINNNSLVCKLVYRNFSMLFTGDIEEKAENAILQKYKNNLNMLNSKVLKVAHHGSKTSSSKMLLEAVKPHLAIIGVGENNTFGHPSNITLENLSTIKCKIYRTDENGEIMININKKGEIKINKML